MIYVANIEESEIKIYFDNLHFLLSKNVKREAAEFLLNS